jgi:hypothetical protein
VDADYRDDDDLDAALDAALTGPPRPDGATPSPAATPTSWASRGDDDEGTTGGDGDDGTRRLFRRRP